jgi:hypothetical protein
MQRRQQRVDDREGGEKVKNQSCAGVFLIAIVNRLDLKNDRSDMDKNGK